MTLEKAVEEYVALRRALGFKIVQAPRLRDFARYLRRERAPFITTDLALRWAIQPSAAQPAYWASRLGAVRQLARHLKGFDSRTEIPPLGLLPFRTKRRDPYLYTEVDIRLLLEEARRVASKTGLRRATYSTLIGMLAVTGLRSSEAVALDDPDVDLDQGVLTIRETKFRKSRLVPLHPSARDALRRYRRDRDHLFRCRMTKAFLVGEEGRRLHQDSIERTFRAICRRAGIGRADRPPPRLHDFRHCLAVRALIAWYRGGADVERQLPVLSTFLGHAHVADTYWYLTAAPELLRLAAERADHAGE